MPASTVWAQLFRFRQSERKAGAELLEADQPVRLPPSVEPHELPPEFEQILQVQVLGYRERLAIFQGHRLRVLDPIWTLVPRDR